ncbi:MAG TPA: ATP-binding cassette domain-containing protein [Thermoanaerobaculia bacterium]|nr:ATP-binding cassette domain-containing protein [Thermoanaerobaculia bacterium]
MRGPAPVPSPAASAAGIDPQSHLTVRNLTLSYGERVLMRSLDFTVLRGDVFILMGGSGSGKSTLLRYLLGLKTPGPGEGEIFFGAESFSGASLERRQEMLRRVGVLYQGGALWSSMTLAENVALVLEQYTNLPPAEIRELAALKLALVGLRGFEDYYPSEISGGMQKRAGLARAIALDPELLFFDEPSAGLDPFSSRRLDDLILEMRDSLGATVVVVTHELASIFAIGSKAIFLDAESHGLLATGSPAELRDHGPEKVQRFLNRERDAATAEVNL